jgi:hypothetical protein
MISNRKRSQDPNASPLVRSQFNWISDSAYQRFPQVIRAIEQKRPIPQRERDRIANRLIFAAAVYRVRKKAPKLTPAQHSRWLEGAAAISTRLVKHLYGKDPAALASGWSGGGLQSPLGLLLPTLQEVAVERRRDATTAAVLLSRVITLSLMLADLVDAANRDARRREIVQQASANPHHGHGGKRREGPNPTGELVHTTFDIYASVRKRYPKSGPRPAFGGPMIGFVRACLAVIDPGLQNMTASRIRGHYDRWRARARTQVHISR